MNILGIHFGHDGSVCVVKDGKISANVLRERQVRHKHAMAISSECIKIALKNAGLHSSDIDFIAITSTQGTDLICALVPGMQIKPDYKCKYLPKVSAELSKGIPGFDPEIPLAANYIDAMKTDGKEFTLHPVDKVLTEEFSHLSKEELCYFGVPQSFPGEQLWPTAQGLNSLAENTNLEGEQLRKHGFHLPLEINFEGRVVPGAFIHHHVSHAASSFYRSPFTQAAIFTQDGHYSSHPLNVGGFFWGNGNSILPLTPHYAPLGYFYEETGQFLRLSVLGTPGKLMGLAPYGTPRFFHKRFIGNDIDLQSRGLPSAGHSFLVNALRAMVSDGADLAKLGQPEKYISPVNADLAASAQLIFEENRLAAVECLSKIIQRLELEAEGLCLSGGVSLNCPANTRIAQESAFDQIFIEPNCDDGGLAVGAALYLTHHLLNVPRPEYKNCAHLPEGKEHEQHPFLSTASPSVKDMKSELKKRAGLIEWTQVADVSGEAARAIAQGKLVAWYQGPSEVGPRALGRRSLLADARKSETWQKVNLAKNRELWRPFAPAVLESEAGKWFKDLPLPSPYMLFTGKVIGDQLPGVTHVDGTSRIQTVSDEDTHFAKLLKSFQKITGVPVVLNTSLNGRGQPIVETAEDVLDVFTQGLSDILFLGPFKVERRE